MSPRPMAATPKLHSQSCVCVCVFVCVFVCVALKLAQSLLGLMVPCHLQYMCARSLSACAGPLVRARTCALGLRTHCQRVCWICRSTKSQSTQCGQVCMVFGIDYHDAVQKPCPGQLTRSSLAVEARCVQCLGLDELMGCAGGSSTAEVSVRYPRYLPERNWDSQQRRFESH